MKKKKSISMILEIILFLLGAFLAIGVKFIFNACGAKEDGSFMTCHYAELTVFALGIAMAAIALFSVLAKDKKAQASYAASLIPVAVVTMLVPKTLIKTCMMDSMRCNSILRPATICICATIIVVAIIVFAINFRGDKDNEVK